MGIFVPVLGPCFSSDLGRIFHTVIFYILMKTLIRSMQARNEILLS